MIIDNESKYMSADHRSISIEGYLRTQGEIDNQIEMKVIELINKLKGLERSDDRRQPFVRTDTELMPGDKLNEIRDEKTLCKRIPMHERRLI